ncbi:helix-turn-helix transcriptional regulator [Streptomyces sp. NPDC096030]|uniref:helix-turn-helix domain-containing protein n=1 Tax=Streptomyces sp. NPDC096030 TaxID=3155423 RepID=UPI0033344E6E
MHQPPTTQVDGADLRRRRMAAGVEISELAAAAGISRRYLSHLETGTRSRMRPAPHKRLFAALEAAEQAPLTPHEGPNKKE